MVFGTETDATQNTTFAPLANVTVNGCLDIEEMKGRINALKKPHLVYSFWKPDDFGNYKALNLHAGEAFCIRKGFNVARKDGLILGFSSFNLVFLFKSDVHDGLPEPDQLLPGGTNRATVQAQWQLRADRANKLLKDMYEYIGVSATESFMTPDRNRQTQKPAVYVAGVIDMFQNNHRLKKPIEVGNRIYLTMPRIIVNEDLTDLIGEPQTEFFLRDQGKDYFKCMMLVQVLDKSIHLWRLPYVQEFARGLLKRGTNMSDDDIDTAMERLFEETDPITEKEVFWKFCDGLAESLNNQVGIAYSNAKFGQKFNTLLSHKSVR